MRTAKQLMVELLEKFINTCNELEQESLRDDILFLLDRVYEEYTGQGRDTDPAEANLRYIDAIDILELIDEAEDDGQWLDEAYDIIM